MPPLDGCDMELFLNLLWLAIAIAAVLTAPRRSRRVSFAIGCALVLLFPIVSVSDDLLLAGHESSEEALAIVVDAVIFVITLVTIARVLAVRPRRAAVVSLPTTDPRSPPAASR
jgi:hypothetical protein